MVMHAIVTQLIIMETTSWPSWSPLRQPGKAPVYMCRSEPQMQVDVIFKTASNCAALICG
jgi:hypothetical protein